MEIARLPYLSAVCSESLRFHPIAIGCFGRRVLKPIVVDGYELEPGTWIHASIYLAHRRSSVYPNPLRFEPERFLRRQFSPYEFLPFGGGHRRCLGDAFVQFEMKLVIATILKSLALSLTTMTPLTPVRQGVSMAPPIDLQMRVDHIF
jgi:cytochrome P450